MAMSSAARQYDADLKQKAAILLLRHRQLFDAGGVMIYELGFWNDQPHIRQIMEIAVYLLVRKHTRPSWESLTSEFGAMADDVTPTIFHNGMNLLKLAYQSDVFESYEEHTLMAVNTYIHDMAVRELKVNVNPADIPEALMQIKKTGDIISGDIFERPPILNPFDNIRENLADSVKVPFGIDFIDEILDGGAVPGEFVGILAPPAGGKTTLALQIGDSVVRNNMGWCHASTEQSMKGDLSLRMACLASGMTRKQIRGGDAIMCPEAEARLEAVKDAWRRNMRFLDLSRHLIPSIPAFFDKVDEAQEELGNQTIRFLTIDWWGRMKDRFVRKLSERLSDAQVRMLSREWMDELRQEAMRRDIVLVLFHQLKGAVAGKGPKHKPTSHDAQEDTNFNNLMDFCFVIGKMTSGQVCRFYSDKARSTSRTERYIRLDGPHCKFLAATDDEVPKDLRNSKDNTGFDDVSDYIEE